MTGISVPPPPVNQAWNMQGSLQGTFAALPACSTMPILTPFTSLALVGGKAYFTYFTPLVNVRCSFLAVSSGSVAAANVTTGMVGLYREVQSGPSSPLTSLEVLTTSTSSAFFLTDDNDIYNSELQDVVTLVAGVRYAAALLVISSSLDEGSVLGVSINSNLLQGSSARPAIAQAFDMTELVDVPSTIGGATNIAFYANMNYNELVS